MVIGIPLGPVMFPEFQKNIIEFERKWGTLAQEARTQPVQTKHTGPKAQLPVLWALFQAMKSWPTPAAQELQCPTLLVSGSRNQSTMSWIAANAQTLESQNIRVARLEGLNHAGEFTEINQVFPSVYAFLQEHLRSK